MMEIFGKVFFYFDGLTFFFAAVAVLVSIPSFVYAFGYLKGHYTRGRRLAASLLGWVFLLAMLAVFFSRNMLIFLISWEVMALSSYFLVVFDHERDDAVRAGTIYLVMTHLGTAFLMAGMLILHAHAGSFDLQAVKGVIPSLTRGERSILFLLFLVGFGTKAGLVPMHIWLPYAHPEAPSHISSIMSGVMIKTGVYGILRFVVSLLGVQESWWGILVMALAAASCLAGIMYALTEKDMKRLLAYSSVENMGVIFLGVGAAMVLLAAGNTLLAAVALSAGLFHVLNHAMAKGLLFLGAGSVYSATGTRDIEKLGGLARRMGWTSACFLAGAMAICALPPLNIFASEWLLFQALVNAAMQSSGHIKVFMGLSVACLALTSGLVVACFVKAFGIAFLGMPRSKRVQEAAESPLSMRLPMAFFALAALALGLASAPVLGIIGKVSGQCLGLQPHTLSLASRGMYITPSGAGGASLCVPLVLAAVLAASLGAWVILRRKGPRPQAITGTWDCGYYQLTPRNEYTATAFSKPFHIAFHFFLLPFRKTEKIRDSFYHVKYFKYEVFTTPVFKKYLYTPVMKAVLRAASHTRKLQMGSIHWYLGYIFIAMCVLVAVASGR